MLPSLPLSFCAPILCFLLSFSLLLPLYLWEMKAGEIEAAVHAFLHLSRKRSYRKKHRWGKRKQTRNRKRQSWKPKKVKEGIEKRKSLILFCININCFNFSRSPKKGDELEILKNGTGQIIRKRRKGRHWD